MNIVKNRKLYFIFSAILIIPGIISLILFGLKLSIEFTGGSSLEIVSEKRIERGSVEKIFNNQKIKIERITSLDPNSIIVRSEIIDQKQKNKIILDLKKTDTSIKESKFETVGPSIGQETQINAIKAVLLASFVISIYVALAFRKVSKPISSWKYGACIIITLLHDVLIVIGAFSIFGVIFGVEIDSLFITALLTVMGFSVHDTIVVFDRIRENLTKNYKIPFETIVNNSLLETINRSLNTSITVILMLFALLLFGGESIRWFILALFIGMVVGTYSSIFNASQLLVEWYEYDKKRKNKSK